jgi:hypothetical protein
LGHPSETKLTLGAAAWCMFDLPGVPALTSHPVAAGSLRMLEPKGHEKK